MGNHSQSSSTPNDEGDGNSGSPEYIAFFLVPFFFLLGLLGVLICHILKRKGYRCTTESEEDEELEKEDNEETEKGDLNDTFSEGNTDTVGQIVHYIMKNEANSDALKAMVQNSIESDGAPSLTRWRCHFPNNGSSTRGQSSTEA